MTNLIHVAFEDGKNAKKMEKQLKLLLKEHGGTYEFTSDKGTGFKFATEVAASKFSYTANRLGFYATEAN